MGERGRCLTLSLRGRVSSCPSPSGGYYHTRVRVGVHDLSLVLPLTLPVSEKTSPEGRGDDVLAISSLTKKERFLPVDGIITAAMYSRRR